MIRVAGTALAPEVLQKLAVVVLTGFGVISACTSLATGLLLLTSFCFGAAAFSLVLDFCPNHEFPNFLASMELPCIHPGLPQEAPCVDPAKDVQIPEAIDHALSDLYEHVLKEHVYAWYGMISYDEEFVQEIRQLLRYMTATLLRRLSRVNLTTLITRKAIPIGLGHLDACFYARQYEKLFKADYRESYFDLMSPNVHPATQTRENEVLYIQSVAKRILQQVVSKHNLRSGSVEVLLSDILSGAVLQPLMDALADPDIINYILEVSFSLEPSRTFEPFNGENVELLKKFVTVSRPQNLSTLYTDLSGILKNQQTLCAFMKFLREEGAINQLQLCLSIEDFNKRIMNPDLSQSEVDTLHKNALDLFNHYLKPDAIHHVALDDLLVQEIEQILLGKKEDVIKLRTTPPLFQAYESIYINLESLCPAFHKSVQYFSMLLGRRGADAHEEGSKTYGRSNWRAAIKKSKPKPAKGNVEAFPSQPLIRVESVPISLGPLPRSSQCLEPARPASQIDLAQNVALESLKTGDLRFPHSKSMTNLRVYDQGSMPPNHDVVPRRRLSWTRAYGTALGEFNPSAPVETTTTFGATNPRNRPSISSVKSQTLPLHLGLAEQERQSGLRGMARQLKKTISLIPQHSKNCSGSDRNLSRVKSGPFRASDTIGKSFNKLKQGVLGRSMDGILDDPLEPGFDIAEICDSKEKEESLSNCSGSLVDILEYRDLTTWRVTIPRLSTDLDNGGKACFVFVIEVQRIDVASQKANAEDLHWSVTRRYSEFYALESKLTEFHGEFKDAKLPPRPKMFSGKGLDVMQSKKEALEEYLRCLLQKSALKGSEILFTFLTSTEEFTVAASQLGKMIKNVPMPKLTKEKLELKPFIEAFFASTQAEPAKPSLDCLVGGDFSDKDFEQPIDDHPLFRNNQGKMEDNQGGHCGKYFSSLLPRQELGVYDTLMYLGLKVFKISLWKGQILQALRILLRNTLDHFVEYAIASELVQVLSVGRVAHLCRLAESAIFEPAPARTDQDKLERKQVALKNFQDFLRPLIQLPIGETEFEGGLDFVFNSLQDPVINKQLAYVLLDTAVVELFPELVVKST